MSSHKLDKSHESSAVSSKRTLLKQEEVDLTDNPSSKASLNSVHPISICINSVETSDDKMVQEYVNDVEDACDIDNVSEDLKKFKMEDTELKNKTDDLSSLNDHCDLKDKKRIKHLVRCEAVRESSLSPPPTNLETNQIEPPINSNHLTVYTKNSSKSSQNSCSLSNSGTSSPSLSRDSSSENNDLTSSELQSFLVETLRKSLKDRMFIFRIENDIIQLIKDSSKETFKFTSTSSYNRMLIHKVAAYFGLEHNVDHTHSAIIVTKTKTTRIPEIKLKDLIKDDESTDEPKKLILKRDSTSLEDSSSSSFDKDKSPDSHLNGSLSDSSRSRSLEEREEHYERVRARIFSEDSRTSSGEAKNENEAKPEVVEINNSDSSSPQTTSQVNCDNKTDNSPQLIITNNKAVDGQVSKNPDENMNVLLNGTNNDTSNGNISNRTKYDSQRNKQLDYSNGKLANQNRFQRNSKANYKGNDNNDRHAKSNINKPTSQNKPFNLRYLANSFDGLCAPRYSNQNSYNQTNPNQFTFDNSCIPLLSNDQCNHVNSFMLPLMTNQLSTNVPNSFVANPATISPSFTYNNIPMPNYHQMMVYNNVQPICGPNPVVPYPQLSASQSYNSFVPFQQPIPASNVHSIPNVPSNYKNQQLNDRDKNLLKQSNYIKNILVPQSFNNHQMSYAHNTVHPQMNFPDAVDRNLGSVQYNMAHHQISGDMFSHRNFMQAPSQVNLNLNNLKRQSNEPLLSNAPLLHHHPIPSQPHYNQHILKPIYNPPKQFNNNVKYYNNRNNCNNNNNKRTDNYRNSSNNKMKH